MMVLSNELRTIVLLKNVKLIFYLSKTWFILFYFIILKLLFC